jgi:hypothetical protein
MPQQRQQNLKTELGRGLFYLGRSFWDGLLKIGKERWQT